jgi:hypothetical protein
MPLGAGSSLVVTLVSRLTRRTSGYAAATLLSQFDVLECGIKERFIDPRIQRPREYLVDAATGHDITAQEKIHDSLLPGERGSAGAPVSQ